MKKTEKGKKWKKNCERRKKKVTKTAAGIAIQ